jgi:hypothetical protein
MKFIILLMLPTLISAKSLSLKDLTPSSDISDIKQVVRKPRPVVVKVDLGPNPLELPSNKPAYRNDIPVKPDYMMIQHNSSGQSDMQMYQALRSVGRTHP